MAAALACEVFGCRFRNPVLLAAGTAGFGRELDGIVDLDAIGGLVSKAVSLLPRHGNPPPRVAEFAGGMLNSVGLANPGVVHVREHELPWLAGRLGMTRLIVNVVGFEVDEYAAVISALAGSDAISAFELNLSCPNSHAGGIEFGADVTTIAAVVAACRRATALPLIVKLSPALPDIAGAALAARDAGADAASVVNTVPGLLYEDGAGQRTRLGQGNGGLSGPALLPVGVLATARVVERTGMPVIGVGGIRSAADVRQYLRAGASLVAIGTAALADPRLPERIVRELEESDG